ncbi:MAG: FAD-binding oxidoreductase [Myxococcales bacterium]|nr:FAD-binding oxidoreductase [Myxococcales bacterium]
MSTPTSTRTRSHWGWGFADRFPDGAARANLGKLLGARLGFEGLSVAEPVPLDAATIREPRIQPPSHSAALCSSALTERASHCYGKNYRDLIRAFSGRFENAPDIVARPTTEAQIAPLLDWASSEGVAVIPFGGGTSVCGGVEGDVGDRYRGVLSLDLTGLDRVLELDDCSRLARIQAGATVPQINRALGTHGLALRHYPQSYELATLGGYIATRSGGHYATLYTHIDELVAGTRMLTPSGVFETRCLPGSGAGPSPDRLVCGSEGILGVITEAWIRIQAKPIFRGQASVHFSSFSNAVEAVRAVAQSGLNPANCRLLDPREAALNMVAFDGSAVLILAFESASQPIEALLRQALAIATAYEGRCPDGPRLRTTRAGDPDEGASGGEGAAKSWRQAFLDAPYLLNVCVSLGVIADTFETAVTWKRFAAFHEGVIARVRAAMKEACGMGRISCRFTHVYPDGPAPYYTFLAPARRGAEIEQWMAIKSAAGKAVVDLGGTITHHHAVGRVHRPDYDRQRPELFARALSAARRAVDPAGIMNPGVLIDG